MDNRWHPAMWDWDRDELTAALSPKRSQCSRCGRRTWAFATTGECRGCKSDDAERERQAFWNEQRHRNALELARMKERGELELVDYKGIDNE